MYKLIIAALILMFTFVGMPTFVNAQQGVQDGTMNQTPATDGTTQTTGTTEDRGGFDWRWLLPLLAVPFFFLLKRDTREEDRSEYRDQRFAGSKGGESRRDKDTEIL